MSAFLARLAARAVGQVPVAQPRLPSLFEAPSEPAEPRHALEAIDDEVAVGPEATATPASADSPVGAATSPTAALAIRDRATKRTEPSRPGQDQDVRRPRTVVADHAGPGEGELAADPAVAPQTSPVVPAMPLSVATPVASRSADEGVRIASPSAAEPPPVRVHIGRLEIRANLPEPAPVRPPARQGREEARSVSLADYLRGAR